MVAQNKRSKSRQLPSSAPRRHKSHGLIWSIIFVSLIVVAAIILINLFQPLHPSSNNPSEPDSTTSESSNPATVKGDSTSIDHPDDSSDNLDPLIKDKTPQKHEGSSANASASLTGSISYTNVSNGQLSVRVNIDQFLESGTCTLHLLQGAHDNYFEAPIAFSASTSTCQGFDVDISDLPSGDYELRIDLTSSEKTGSINGKVTL